jgi:heterotetrameric sarcosine oxidase gamma subunit
MSVSAPDLSTPGTPPVVAEQPRSFVQIMARKGRAEALEGAVRRAFRLDLPGPGRWASGPDANGTWLQPGGWLLDAAPGDFLARVNAAVGDLASVVDQSYGRSMVRISGPAARDVLATCCRLDLHPRAFGPRSAAATQLAHVPGVIRRLDDASGFDLIVGSSYARWLMEELYEASASEAVLAQGRRFASG